MRDARRSDLAAVPHAAKQERDFGRERSGIQMGFVKDDVPQGGTKELPILRAAEHILQHRVVRDDNVRDLAPRRFATPRAARFPLFGFLRLAILLRGFAREMEETQPLLILEQTVKPRHLVRDQRVHRIENQAAHARFVAPSRLVPQPCEYRQKKRFGFSRASAGGDYK